jgi:hypothetical protein
MASIIISALILCAVLYLVARNEAEISLPVVLMITAGVSIVSLILNNVHPLASLLSLFLLAWSIQRFCYLRWSKAALVTGIYFCANVGVALVIHMIRGA